MDKTTDKTMNYKVGDTVMLILDTPKYANYGCDKTDHKKIFKVNKRLRDNQYEIVAVRGYTVYWVYGVMLRPADSQLMFDFMYE